MKTIIVDEEKFLSNPDFFTKTLQEFCPQETAESMLNTIRNRCFYCFVFNENEEVVSWSRTAKPWDRKTLYCIRQVETKVEHRGKGYAGFCYKASEEYISMNDEKAKRIFVFVDEENTSSIRFHEKLGFSKSSKVSKYLKDLYGWDSACMLEKEISVENVIEIIL